MVATAARKREPSSQRLLTVEDVAALPTELPSGPVDYELNNGRLVTVALPGDIHGAIQLNIGAELKLQGERSGHGKARGEVGIVLWRDPDRLVGADAVFIAKKSLPLRLTKEGYLETIPQLAVEIKSKNDHWPEILEKVEDYLEAGVQVVWVADPAKRAVTAYRRDQEPQVFSEDTTLTVEDIIPGLKIAVRDVFQV